MNRLKKHIGIINNRYIAWLLKLSQGYRTKILLDLSLGVISIVLSLSFIWVSKLSIDIAVSGNLDGKLLQFAVLLATLIIAQYGCSILQVKINNTYAIKIVNSLREKLFKHLMTSTIGSKKRFHTGDLLARLNDDANKACSTLSSTLPAIAVTLFEFVLSFIFMSKIEPRLTWIVVIIMPLAFCLSKWYFAKIRRLTHDIRSVDSHINSHIQEHLQNREVLSTMDSVTGSLSFLNSLNSDLYKKTINRVNYNLFSRTIIRIGFSAGYITAFVWGIESLSQGAISFGAMAAFLQLVSRVQNPIVKVGANILTASQATTSIDRLIEIEELQLEEQGTPQTLTGSLGVKISNLTYQYEDSNRIIFNNFSHDFTPNKMHIIVGQTGAGKSTLLRMILGSLTPSQGSVELYNGECKIACSPQLRPNYSYIPQGNTLLSGTIRDNLVLFNEDVSDEDIAEALHIAVADFVYSLPDGLQTKCTERGGGLSEGEAQRIAIARGLLRKGGIVMLDEPTSALDSTTEHTLMQRLIDYAKNRTIIMVTHREVVDNYGSMVRIGK